LVPCRFRQAPGRPTWDSDAEDDEHEDEPQLDFDDEHDDCPADETLEQSMGRLKWEDVGRTLTDQRAASASMPESIIPGLHFANFREESWLNWFLHWVPLETIAEIVEATNNGPSDPLSNETSLDFRPGASPFASCFFWGLFLTRVSQVRMWAPFN
jgi:hypothetical protein